MSDCSCAYIINACNCIQMITEIERVLTKNQKYQCIECL